MAVNKWTMKFMCLDVTTTGLGRRSPKTVARIPNHNPSSHNGTVTWPHRLTFSKVVTEDHLRPGTLYQHFKTHREVNMHEMVCMVKTNDVAMMCNAVHMHKTACRVKTCDAVNPHNAIHMLKTICTTNT